MLLVSSFNGLVMDYHIAQVLLHLLTAVMKCFFKRPPETQKALAAALAAGLADFHQVLLDMWLLSLSFLSLLRPFIIIIIIVITIGSILIIIITCVEIMDFPSVGANSK
jgi:hypothetical protein